MADKRIGNQFWKARAKHGRDKIFKTPELMLEAACDYFQWVEDNPLNKAIVYQGAVSDQPEELMRAMTIKGLCIFWGVNSIYLSDFVGKLDLETKEGKDFNVVISTIKEIIETQKFEGASAGLLNPNISVPFDSDSISFNSSSSSKVKHIGFSRKTFLPTSKAAFAY